MITNINYSSMSTRNLLALSRTDMANERTLLAYLRTGMTFIITGVGIIRFLKDGVFIVICGSVFIITGVYFLCCGGLRYHRYKHLLKTTPWQD